MKFPKKILLYSLFGVLIFSIIKVLPNNTLGNIDAVLISIITVILCVCLEKTMTTNLCPKPVVQQCNAPASNTENFNLLEKIKELTTGSSSKPTKTVEHQTQPTQPKSSPTKSTQPTQPKSTQPTQPKSTQPTQPKSSPTKSTQPKTSPTQPKTSPTQPKSTQTTQPTQPKSSPTKSTQVILKPTDTKLESSLSDSEKISFPFSKAYMVSVLNDVKSANENQEIAKKIQLRSSNKYYEILIQIIQTNSLAFNKHLESDHNRLNELIMDIKVRRENKLQDTIKADDLTVSAVGSRELSNTMNKYLQRMVKQGKYIDDNGFVQNMIDNDMKYSMYTKKQHEKLGTYDPTFTNKWNNDYTLLDTTKWMPPIDHRMYKCKTEKQCPVCPSLTKGYPVKLKDFDAVRKVLPPDVINVDYINEKLLTGLP
jgi:hypothetical protein